MKSLAAILFLVLVLAVLIFAALRLFRLVFGRASSKQKLDDASDVVDAAKVGIGMLAAATFFFAPVGFFAFLAGLRLVSVPTVVSMAPGLILVFGGLAFMGTAAKIYSRRKLQKQGRLK